MQSEKDKMITEEIVMLLEETFKKVQGFYLDRNASLFETIENLTYKDASRKLEGIDETIAGHVNHVIFYIVVVQDYLTDVRTGKTDWSESWIVSEVTEREWKELKERLAVEYDKLIQFIHSVEEWTDCDYFGGILSIITHCAYHLGAIRQLIR